MPTPDKSRSDKQDAKEPLVDVSLDSKEGAVKHEKVRDSPRKLSGPEKAESSSNQADDVSKILEVVKLNSKAAPLVPKRPRKKASKKSKDLKKGTKSNEDVDANEVRPSKKKSAKWNNGATATIRTTLGGANISKKSSKGNSLQNDSIGSEVSDVKTERLGAGADHAVESSSKEITSVEPLNSAHDQTRGVSEQNRMKSKVLDHTAPDEITHGENGVLPEDGQTQPKQVSPINSASPLVISSESSAGGVSDDEDQSVQVSTHEPKQNGEAKDHSAKDGSKADDTVMKDAYLTLKSLTLEKRELQRRYFDITHVLGSSLADNTVAVCLLCRKESHDGDGCPSLVCLACGDKGHLSGACPTQRRCSRCQGLGHRAKSCTSKLKSSRATEGILCDICRLDTHDPKGCEMLWRTFAVPSSSETTRIVQAVPIGCYVCGQAGHYGPECSMKPRGWTAPRTGWTFSMKNMSRYVDGSSLLKAIDPPESRSRGLSHGHPSRAQEKHSVYTTDEDEDDQFLNTKLSRPASRGRMKTNIRFATDRPGQYMPPPPPPRAQDYSRHDRPEYDRSYRPRPRSRSPPRYPVREHRERDWDDYNRPPPPPLPRGPPPSSRGQGQGGYRGRGRGGGESFRPFASSGAKAWRQHRI